MSETVDQLIALAECLRDKGFFVDDVDGEAAKRFDDALQLEHNEMARK